MSLAISWLVVCRWPQFPLVFPAELKSIPRPEHKFSSPIHSYKICTVISMSITLAITELKGSLHIPRQQTLFTIFLHHLTSWRSRLLMFLLAKKFSFPRTMVSRSFFVVAVFTILLHQVTAQCGKQCRFRFCKTDGTILPKGSMLLLGAPNRLLSPRVCSPGKPETGTIGRTGEALVFENGRAMPISKFRSEEVKPNFRKTHFLLFPLRIAPGQGPGRRSSRGNQELFLDNLCIVLPILLYDVVGERNKVLQTVTKTKSSDCVSFVTSSPDLLFQLTWDTFDNLDLEVTEPDGDVLNRDNRRTQSGTLNSSVIVCGSPPPGKESAVYRSFTPGSYRIGVMHTTDCGYASETKFQFTVVLNGKVVFEKNRSSTTGAGFTTATFKITLWKGYPED